jgi:hypothetical protein
MNIDAITWREGKPFVTLTTDSPVPFP